MVGKDEQLLANLKELGRFGTMGMALGRKTCICFENSWSEGPKVKKGREIA